MAFEISDEAGQTKLPLHLELFISLVDRGFSLQPNGSPPNGATPKLLENIKAYTKLQSDRKFGKVIWSELDPGERAAHEHVARVLFKAAKQINYIAKLMKKAGQLYNDPKMESSALALVINLDIIDILMKGCPSFQELKEELREEIRVLKQGAPLPETILYG